MSPGASQKDPSLLTVSGLVPGRRSRAGDLLQSLEAGRWLSGRGGGGARGLRERGRPQ